jgi:hypothetical protein
MQSKKGSFVEAVTGTLIGLCYAMPVQYGICVANGIPMTWHQNAIITFWMTVASVVRTYVLRRFFNWLPGWWKRIRCRHQYLFVEGDVYDDVFVHECRFCEHRVKDRFM